MVAATPPPADPNGTEDAAPVRRLPSQWGGGPVWLSSTTEGA
jgi:hypothetical protein